MQLLAGYQQPAAVKLQKADIFQATTRTKQCFLHGKFDNLFCLVFASTFASTFTVFCVFCFALCCQATESYMTRSSLSCTRVFKLMPNKVVKNARNEGSDNKQRQQVTTSDLWKINFRSVPCLDLYGNLGGSIDKSFATLLIRFANHSSKLCQHLEDVWHT